MRKTLITLQLIAALLTPAALHADEGMWTLFDLPDAVFNQMRAEGFAMPKEMLYDDSLALKNSVVSFGGYCTGAVVSPMGLLLTNHHCGFESIRSHSTVEHDYMLNGFYADSLGAELPNEGLFVSFTLSQQDVTQRLQNLGIDTLDAYGKTLLIDSLQGAMTESAKARDSSMYVEIDAYYEGNAYYATTYQRYEDVRLVYAPPKSMGKFGGETDNWMWPRQTCDVSVFRVYVDPETGRPARYSPRNVPMRPRAWLPVSMEGYKDGDFAMIMGTPGSTERYRSSYGIQEMRDAINDPMQQVRGVKQEVMKRHMDASEEVRIKYDSKYAQSSNYWKNAIGMNKCIDSIGIVRMKQAYEARIRQWADTCKDAPRKLDMELLGRLYAKRSEAMRAFTFFAETFTRRSNCEIAIRAMKYSNGMPVKGAGKSLRKQYVQFDDNSDKWDMELDKDVFAALLSNYRRQVPEKYHPAFYKKIDEDFGGDYAAYAKALWDNSILMRQGARIPVRMTRRMKKDLGIEMSMALVETLADIKLVIDETGDSITEQERWLCLAKLRMEQDMPHYSDANLTMRMTYGQVGGYSIGGYNSGYYTTAQSMVAKMAQAENNADYLAEPLMCQLLGRDDFGVFTDSVSHTLNLCFLTNNDITGGNSGSPVIDAKGRLTGLAFDGNWDSLSADIFFDSTLARCICVDIRYILYLMRHWAHADRLLEEMGVR